MNYSKRKMSSRLPSIPCFPELREGIEAVAKLEGKSIVQVIRDAISFYLSSRNTKSIADNT